MSHHKPCKRCQGTTLEGKQCKNKISCEERCLKYCHLHSKGYPKTNTHCTTPFRREYFASHGNMPKKGKGKGKK